MFQRTIAEGLRICEGPYGPRREAMLFCCQHKEVASWSCQTCTLYLHSELGTSWFCTGQWLSSRLHWLGWLGGEATESSCFMLDIAERRWRRVGFAQRCACVVLHFCVLTSNHQKLASATGEHPVLLGQVEVATGTRLKVWLHLVGVVFSLMHDVVNSLIGSLTCTGGTETCVFF